MHRCSAIPAATLRQVVNTRAMCRMRPETCSPVTTSRGAAGSSERDVPSEQKTPSTYPSTFTTQARGSKQRARARSHTHTALMLALREDPARIQTPAGGRLTSAHPRDRVLWPGRRSQPSSQPRSRKENGI